MRGWVISESFSVEHKYEHVGNNKPIRNGYEYELRSSGYENNTLSGKRGSPAVFDR
jgi:hypothetical protein